MQRNSQARQVERLQREPWDQDITKLQSGTMESGYHNITDWNHGIRISQNYKVEPLDWDITKSQIGTMGSGITKLKIGTM